MKKLHVVPWRFSVFWIILVCVIAGVRPCLQCDLVIRNMHEDFLATKSKMTVQEQMDLKQIISHAYVTYQDTSMQLSGVIGVSNIDFNSISIVNCWIFCLCLQVDFAQCESFSIRYRP